MSVFAITTIGIKLPIERLMPEDVLRIRTVGIFATAQKASEVLTKNWGGLDEAGYYRYAVIEEVKFGLYPDQKMISWWTYDREKERWTEIGLAQLPPELPDMNLLGYASIG